MCTQDARSALYIVEASIHFRNDRIYYPYTLVIQFIMDQS